MDSGNLTSLSGCHVVAVPYPGRGHINPMMNLCKLLASRGVVITFVVTEEWLGFIGSDPKPPNIQLRSIPNVIPSEVGRAKDFAGFLEAVSTKMEAPFEKCLSVLQPPVRWMIADTYLPWVVAVGNRRNIPVASLWPMSPTMFSVLYHFDRFESNGHFPLPESPGQGDERIDYIPGVKSIRLEDLYSLLRSAHLRPNGSKNMKSALDRALEAFCWVPKAQCLLFTSFYELDTHVVDILSAELPFPVYTVGPLIPYMALLETPTAPNLNDMDYFRWLDSQPRSSVLYVSLGSFLSVSSTQMDEFAKGIHASGVRFIWITRHDPPWLQELSGEMGLVVPWCDQLRVLCHSSIGGFLTHCGWNSTLEGVFAGQPMLNFPIFWDQFPDSKLINEDWKVGIKLRKDGGLDSIVKSDEIALAIHRLMDLNGDESKNLRKRAKELQEACVRAIGNGGSSNTNLDTFVKNLERGYN